MRYLVEDAAGKRHEVEVSDAGGGRTRVRYGGRDWTVDATRRPGLVSLLLEGERAFVAGGGHVIEHRITDARRATRASGAPAGGGAAVLRCPMPGRVVRVECAPGDAVAAGAGLVVVEAMKMENELRAPRAGTVTAVRVKPGDPVEAGAVLVELG